MWSWCTTIIISSDGMKPGGRGRHRLKEARVFCTITMMSLRFTSSELKALTDEVDVDECRESENLLRRRLNIPSRPCDMLLSAALLLKAGNSSGLAMW